MNVANNNYKSYLQRPIVKVKIYLYAVKSLLACSWIEKFQTVPPITIQDLLPLLDYKKEKLEVEQLLKRRNLGEEFNMTVPLPILNNYIQEECIRIKNYIPTLKEEQRNATEKLDHLFRQTLQLIYGH